MHVYDISLKMKKKLWEMIHKFFFFTKMQILKGQKSMWIFFCFYIISILWEVYVSSKFQLYIQEKYMEGIS